MSVVGGKKVVFCEGKLSSLDYSLLNRLVDGFPDAPSIVPAGSKFTFSVFARGYFFPEEVRHKRFIVFRDRDFDALPDGGIRLLEPETELGKKNVFLTHRACIENYLIDANWIHEYWSDRYAEKQENPQSKWGHGNSPGIEELQSWIEKGAERIKAYQAVRWALSDIQRIGHPRAILKTTWTGGSGRLPPSLDLDDCQGQALVLIENFRTNTDMVTKDAFLESFDKYWIRFSEQTFWEDKKYMIWFHGKDIQKSMQQLRPGFISLSHYFLPGISKIDLKRHPDLLELENIIKAM